MKSMSGKIANRFAEKQISKLAKPIKKLAARVAGSAGTKLKKTSSKRKALLDSKANPKALAISKKKVSKGLQKLGLKSAGFGRYHKGKGQPITHWVMRNPKNGLYVLADKEIRAKLLGKSAKKVAKPVGKTVAKPLEKKIKKPAGRPTNAKKAHEAKKQQLTKLHLARLDKARAEKLAKAGKKPNTPMTKREQLKRDASVRKLHGVLDKHFKDTKSTKKAAPGKSA